MSEVLWSDDELEFHRSVSKRVTNPQAEWKTNDRVRHKHRIFNLVSEDNNKNTVQRQNRDCMWSTAKLAFAVQATFSALLGRQEN